MKREKEKKTFDYYIVIIGGVTRNAQSFLFSLKVNQEALQRQIEGGAENSSRKESPISVNQIQDECNPEKSGLCKSCKRSCAGADTTAKPEKGSGDTFSSGDDHQLAVENNHQNVQEGDGDK